MDYSDHNKELLAKLYHQQQAWNMQIPIHKGYTLRDKVVLWALILHADRRELGCYPSLKTLASDTGLSIQSVSKSTQNLMRRGLIHIERRGKKRSNFYTLTHPKMPSWDKEDE